MNRFSCVKIAIAGIALVSSIAGDAAGFEDNWRERRLETPLGFDSVSDIDRGIAGNRDELGRRIEVSGPYGSSLASALGNSIAVEAGAGATVVINAMQINKGNQRATTIVDGDTVERMFQVEPSAGPSK